MTLQHPGELRYGWLPLFIAAALIIMLAPLFWRQAALPDNQQIARGYENAALYHETYPLYRYAYSRLRQGELPLWSASQFCGVPLLNNPALGLFQPLNLAFLLPQTAQAMALASFLGIACLGVFFLLFARSLDVSYGAAFIGAIAAAFSGAAAAAMVRPGVMAAFAWAPLLFWIMRAHARNHHPALIPAAGLAGGMMLLSESLLLSGMLLLSALLYRLALAPLRPLSDWKRLLPQVLLLIPAASLAVAAVQWLPALLWAQHLARPWQHLAAVRVGGLLPPSPPALLMHMAAPGDSVLPHVGYVGILALILAPAALFSQNSRRDPYFFLLFSVLCIGLSLLLYQAAPDVSRALWFPATLSLAALAALGASRLLTPARDVLSPRLWLAAALAVAAGVTLLLLVPDTRSRGFIVITLALLLAALLRFRPVLYLCTFLAALLLLADLAISNTANYRHPYTDLPQAYAREAALLQELEEQAVGGRALVDVTLLETAASPNMGWLLPIELAGGAFWPLTKQQAAWWDALAADPAAPFYPQARPGSPNSKLLRHMSVKAVLAGREADWEAAASESPMLQQRQVRPQAPLQIFSLHDALPLCWWVPGWAVAGDIDAAIAAMTDPAFDPTETAVVDVNSPGFEMLVALVRQDSEPPDTAAQCTLQRRGEEEVVLRVSAPAPGLVVTTESFSPGWRAWINGKATPLLQVNGLFKGVVVPAGDSEITLRYRPYPLFAGAVISAFALLLLICSGLWLFFRGSPGPAAGTEDSR